MDLSVVGLNRPVTCFHFSDSVTEKGDLPQQDPEAAVAPATTYALYVYPPIILSPTTRQSCQSTALLDAHFLYLL